MNDTNERIKREREKKKLASPNYEGEQDPPNYGFFSSREIMGPRVFFSRTRDKNEGTPRS